MTSDIKAVIAAFAPSTSPLSIAVSTAACCGIQQFKRGDAKTAGRIAFNTIDRLARPGASKVVSWCPSCFIQIGEVALPAYESAYGTLPFEIAPLVEGFRRAVGTQDAASA